MDVHNVSNLNLFIKKTTTKQLRMLDCFNNLAWITLEWVEHGEKWQRNGTTVLSFPSSTPFVNIAIIENVAFPFHGAIDKLEDL